MNLIPPQPALNFSAGFLFVKKHIPLVICTKENESDKSNIIPFKVKIVNKDN